MEEKAKAAGKGKLAEALEKLASRFHPMSGTEAKGLIPMLAARQIVLEKIAEDALALLMAAKVEGQAAEPWLALRVSLGKLPEHKGKDLFRERPKA